MGYGFNLTREGTDLAHKVSCSKGDVSIAARSLSGPPLSSMVGAYYETSPFAKLYLSQSLSFPHIFY